jgi:hypothetical protein
MSLPAHLQALLARKTVIAPPAAIVAPRDKRPVFEPSQGGSSPRSLSAVIDDMGEVECHDLPMMDNADPEGLALSVDVD